jgi:hypothetical protein
MVKHLKKFASALTLSPLMLLTASRSALAQININIAPPTQFNSLNNITPAGLVSQTINLFLGAAGIVSFVYLLWGGINWVMAGGDKDALDRARKKISNALIGLAITFSSYAFIRIIRILFGIGNIQLTINQIQ